MRYRYTAISLSASEDSESSKSRTRSSRSDCSEENSAEVTKRPSKKVVARQQHVASEAEQGETLFGTSVKVVTCALGSGMLVVPWGAAGSSLLTSWILTALVLLANGWTIMIVIYAIDRWGGTRAYDAQSKQWQGTYRQKGYRIDDLGELLRRAPGRLPALAILWDTALNLSNFFVLVGSMIVTADAMTPLFQLNPVFSFRAPWIVLGSLVCLPLCWADLSFLTYSSSVGVSANVYLFAVLFAAFWVQGVAEDVCIGGVGPGSLACLGNLLYALIFQMCIPEYYTQMRRDDQDPRTFLKWVLVPSFLFLLCLMGAFSTVGYIAYGPTVNANVLMNLPGTPVGRSTQVALTVACLMVYPNMLRPMIKPMLRGMDWLRSFVSPRRVSIDSAEEDASQVSVGAAEDIYEGRLVHTDLEQPVQAEEVTGEVVLVVGDTRGFEKDSLLFIDGATREYGVIKEIIPQKGSTTPFGGTLRLRPRYGKHPIMPILTDTGYPLCAVTQLDVPVGTKVVLDEDPALVTAAVQGESCLHLSFVTGIPVGARIVVGEGARAEKHMVVGVETWEPEPASVQSGLRSHDLVLRLDAELRHNHGARTRVVLDHGPTELVATAIVISVMLVAFFVRNLGVVNVLNGAMSVIVIVGIVPGMCALQLRQTWQDGLLARAASNGSTATSSSCMPLCFRYEAVTVGFMAVSVLAGIGCVFYTDNHAAELTEACFWPAN
eukprot:TRINITY_DN9177_c0_g1_i1.p1 TRINITY_DN9177_c0_g1~~TRINITY_DN9177_c0_g1_i1.p1  ORF type:complete len:718 (-),score=77.35 TRINITY_DN9177_c0_g1_i1:192-2345(-)